MGYVILESDSLLIDLRTYLRIQLPEFMIPAQVIALPHFPLTSNGKLNWRALPDPPMPVTRAVTYEAPRSLSEKAITNIWQDVLKIDRIGIDDDFFDLGGHSLFATQIIIRIKQALHVNITMLELLDHPTIRLLAAFATEIS